MLTAVVLCGVVTLNKIPESISLILFIILFIVWGILLTGNDIYGIRNSNKKRFPVEMDVPFMSGSFAALIIVHPIQFISKNLFDKSFYNFVFNLADDGTLGSSFMVVFLYLMITGFTFKMLIFKWSCHKELNRNKKNDQTEG